MPFRRLQIIVVVIIIQSHAFAELLSNMVEPVYYFSGREAEIKKIEEIYASGEHVVSLVGLSGIGKTEVARQYMVLNRRRYLITWVFDTKSDLRLQFQTLAKQINAHRDYKASVDERLEYCIHSVIGFISSLGKSLFLFDGLEIGENHKIDELAKHGYNGHIMILSQDRVSIKNIINVLALNDADSRMVVKKILKRPMSESEEEWYKSLHGYPIKITEYAYYLKDGGIVDMLSQENSQQDTFTVVSKLLEKLKPNEKKAFIKASLLNIKLLPSRLLSTVADDGKDIDRLAALNLLATKRYVTKDRQAYFEMHNLIRDKLLKTQNAKVIKENATELADAINGIFPEAEKLYGKVLQEWPEMIPTLEALIKNAEEYGVHNDKVLELKKNLLLLRFYILDYKKVRELLDWFVKEQKNFNLDTMSEGAKKSYFMILVNKAAYENFIDDRPDLSIETFHNTIVILEPFHMPYIKHYIHEQYAQVLVYTGKIDQAMEEVLLSRQAMLVEGTIFEPIIRSVLAKALLEKGEYDDALKNIDVAIDVELRAGFDQANEPYNELKAEILLRKGDYSSANEIAQQFYKRACLYFKEGHDLVERARILLAWSQVGLSMIEQAQQNIKIAWDFFYKSEVFTRSGGEALIYMRVVQGEIDIRRANYNKAFDSYLDAEKHLKLLYGQNLKTDLYGYILEKLVFIARRRNDLARAEHYALEHERIFGKFNERARRIDTLSD